MFKINELPEDSKVAIEAVIETALRLRKEIPFFLQGMGNWQSIGSELTNNSGNFYVEECFVPKDGTLRYPKLCADLITANAAISHIKSGSLLRRHESHSKELKFSDFHPYSACHELSMIFLGYANEDQIRTLYEFQEEKLSAFMNCVRVMDYTDGGDVYSSLTTSFKKIAKQKKVHFDSSDVIGRRLLFAIAAEAGHEGVSKLVQQLNEAAQQAYDEFKIDSKDLLYAAMAKILDRGGYDYTPGKIKQMLGVLFSDQQREALENGLPLHQVTESGKIKIYPSKPENIRVPNRLNEVYAEEVSRRGAGNSSSFQGSPYAHSPRSGEQRFAFRKNFDAS